VCIRKYFFPKKSGGVKHGKGNNAKFASKRKKCHDDSTTDRGAIIEWTNTDLAATKCILNTPLPPEEVLD